MLILGSIAIPGSEGPAEHRFRLNLAAIKRLQQFLGSDAGSAMIKWFGQLERPQSASETDEPGSTNPARQVSEATNQAEGRRAYQELLSWAEEHWDDPDSLDAAYRKFFDNLLEWKLLFGPGWTGPMEFEKVNQRAIQLKRGGVNPESVPQDDEEAVEQRRFDLLMKEINASWGDAIRLGQLDASFRGSLPKWSTVFSADWQGRWRLDAIYTRIAELAGSREAVSPPAHSKVRGVHKSERDDGRPPPGVPEWPREAAQPESTALSADQFFHSTGMLSFMGYKVGKVSILSRDRRRRILDYVLLGRLPLVNDRIYMREWGKPRTSTRLRKLANSLAAFARNARRKRSTSWKQAIRDWEDDLAYLRKRYYDGRRREWKWPVTVLHRRT